MICHSSFYLSDIDRYSLIIPFWWTKGGGTQEIDKVFEPIAVVTTLWGANVGAATKMLGTSIKQSQLKYLHYQYVQCGSKIAIPNKMIITHYHLLKLLLSQLS